MNGRLRIIVLSGAALLFGVGTIAQNGNDEVEAGKRWLALMNAPGDKDQTVSKQEFRRYMEKAFDEADTDHDGSLDAKELGHLRAMLVSK